MLDMMYNKQGNRLTFAYPDRGDHGGPFSKIGWFDQVLALVAYLVALVSAAGVLVAIYNSMAARQPRHRDPAGAGRRPRSFSQARLSLEAAAIGVLGMIRRVRRLRRDRPAVAAVIRAQTGVLLRRRSPTVRSCCGRPWE